MMNPKMLCRKHLLGEHFELHKHRHLFEKGQSIAGRKGQIEPLRMQERHDILVAEMLARGMNHKSPYTQPSLQKYKDIEKFVVDVNVSIQDLLDRCPTCRTNIISMDAIC